ncbi:hypothetical protein ALC56_10126 [Trachymyrmex septentrionalis]|uniref:DUF7027 domain-containing protein n=4 Tax=Attini TaxID=143999 RepID=A0A158NKM6_ATTCE|nr:PREDICTED: uncharacterized protein LOC105143762 [Acromyrmex echinatior]XP_011050543.1 PREDICTED: uncharacterized protein LOC105143762 [Acromyrmex echinatior]XP_011050544.1 PREDICTED: uncharacterized protein LOC105143762 [Acromyrmex echinatior]XP_011050545.1 PREDICTED: uncharacterized protein LOC105143762 [Acromyrmex echinatior]XP_012058084.1 PREDICTED: uncharacterized protein LOC105621221 [Atta cephalotes]XP_018056217.1 PREDICTED: uncharacterized protein LOC108692467 [Atta colombica]XP_018
MKIGLLKHFMHYFNLRQGTIVIAIFQMLTSGLGMIFFILGVTHALGIQEMLARDTEDALEREALEEISSFHLNKEKLELAHHTATELEYAMYCGLVITVIHFISSVLLLYGALTSNRHFMTPWMIVKITIIAALAISLFLVEEDCPFLASLGGKADICQRLIVFFLIIASFYVWFVVYSTYKSLETKKGLTHEVHIMKKKYAVPVPLEVPKAVQISVNKPYEI